MVWMDKLSDVSFSAMAVIEDFINNNVKLGKRSLLITYFGNLKSPKLAMEMDQLYAKIQYLPIDRPNEDSQTRCESESEESALTSFNDDQLDFFQLC